jgi:hypothetical protein
MQRGNAIYTEIKQPRSRVDSFLKTHLSQALRLMHSVIFFVPMLFRKLFIQTQYFMFRES